jgi:hypothetical protein
MKLLIIVAFQVAALAAFAAGPPLQEFSTPFNGKDCEIIWSATNQLPRSVKIFRVVPTKFSPSTISNLLQIAELKPDQRKRVDQDGVFAGKDVQFFADRKETRQLNLVPSQGFIVISKDGTEAKIPKEMPIGVPDSKEALRLTLQILEKIGIRQSDLTTNAAGKFLGSSSEASVMHKDKSSGQLFTNIVQRDMSLNRQIEGIPVRGGAGIQAKFGNEGKLAYLSVVWRTVSPDKDCPVPDAAGFIDYVKSGRTLIRNEQANATFKKIVVTNVSFYYWESAGSEPQTRIYPFAVLEAQTDKPGENSNIQLFVGFANE